MHYKATKTSIETMDDLLFGGPITVGSEASGESHRRVYYGLHLAQALPFPKTFLDDAYHIRQQLQVTSDAQLQTEGRMQAIWKQKKQVANLYEALVHIADMYSLAESNERGSSRRSGPPSSHNPNRNVVDHGGIEESKIKGWLTFLQYKFIQEVTSNRE